MEQPFLSDFPRADYPRDATIHQLFAEQVERHPLRVALVMPSTPDTSGRAVTYSELNDWANGLAHDMAEAGVVAGDSIVVMMDRSVELIAAILGILKAGAVYVPLDVNYPKDRISFMLAESGARLILTHASVRSRLDPTWSTPVKEVASQWVPTGALAWQAPAVGATAAAYVMFTSGSTGKPKGVTIPHRGVVRLVRGTQFTPLDETRVLLQLAPVSFDASTLEIWGPLLNGGQCVLFPGGSVPDPALLESVIREQRVTTLWLTASLFNTIVSEQPSALETVSEVLTGGEALSAYHVRLAHERLPKTQLINGYGPTESTTFTTCFRIPRPIPADWTAIPIGSPIANTEVCVLDATLQAVAAGMEGELCIGGDGLALGYWGQADLTAERFVPHPLPERQPERIYRTGDRVRRRSDGNYDFLGRMDDQVKLRGFRIELGEIQSVMLEHSAVGEAIVLLHESAAGERSLVGYYSTKPDLAIDSESLKRFLATRLSEVMVPSVLVRLQRLPLNANGKVDRQALPRPETASSELTSFRAPTNDTEQKVAQIWHELLGRSHISVDENFFDAGGSSILAIRLAARLRSTLGTSLPLVRLYQNPTIRSIASFLDAQASGSVTPGKVGVSRARASSLQSRSVAVIGMAGRFPGARNVGELWQVLLDGRATTRRFTREQLDPSLNPSEVADPAYVPMRGIIDDAECFDHSLFGISLREAEVMDPQHRVFLEVCYEALEDAGYDSERFEGKIGVFGGCGNPTYFNQHLCGRREIVERAGSFITRLGNEKDFLVTRVSYKLGLRGPSVLVNTACSTSLVAISQAIDSLRAGHCDIAIAGGVSVDTPQASGYLYQEGSMLSPDGSCRPFDASAQGTMFNNGCGIVVLKLLEKARADYDRIDAVVLGHGINNDGSQRMSFSAPSVDGQAAAIEAAHLDAGVEPRTISYIETHGTATPVGDPIEVAALTKAFEAGGGAPPQSCLLGSAKSNLGHLVNAAGATGLIKTALCLRTGEIPATLYYTKPNPELNLEATPFYVSGQRQTWEHGSRPHRAGVSSFGVGGTNAHLVLEEPPPAHEPTSSRPVQLLIVSANSNKALTDLAERFAAHLDAHHDTSLADMAFTLQVGRRQHGYRACVVAGNRSVATSRLRSIRAPLRETKSRNAPVAFLFPGQGSQYLRMGAELREVEPVFQEELERCSSLLSEHLGLDLLSLVYPVSGDDGPAEEALRETRYTQPALFAVEYALARLWMSWGIQPSVMVGHSIGELVCATLAGVMTVQDAARLVVARGRLLQACPGGSMLSVRAPIDQVRPLLMTGVDVAAVNSPALCVIAGPDEAIEGMSARLDAAGIPSKRLVTSHAFHSAMVDSVVEPFTEVVRGITLRPPTIPFISTVTGKPITNSEATDPNYWGGHVRRTVQFSAALATLLQDERLHILEVGPRLVGCTCVRQMESRADRVVVGSLGMRSGDGIEQKTILESLGALWCVGVNVDWERFYGFERRRRIALPTYPFERVRCYIEPLPWGQTAPAPSRTVADRDPLGEPASTASRPEFSGIHHDSLSSPDEVASVLQQQLEVMSRQLELVAAVSTDSLLADPADAN